MKGYLMERGTSFNVPSYNENSVMINLTSKGRAFRSAQTIDGGLVVQRQSLDKGDLAAYLKTIYHSFLLIQSRSTCKINK